MLMLANGGTEVGFLKRELYRRIEFFITRQRLKTRFRDFDALRLIEISVNEDCAVVRIVVERRPEKMGRRRGPRAFSLRLGLYQFEREQSIPRLRQKLLDCGMIRQGPRHGTDSGRVRAAR